MLDEVEKQESVKILEFLSYDNLVSLTDTVTGKVVTVENKKEALEAIMLYTRTGEELLKRRKVRREHLYQYLAKEGHIEHPAAEKGTLLKKVLQLWTARKQGTESTLDLEPFVLPCQQQTTTPTKEDSPVAATPSKTDVQDNATPEVEKPTTTTTIDQSEGDEAQLLAVHFSAWFYKMLETLRETVSEWGPQHFWGDVTLTVRCVEPGGEQEIVITGAKEVSEKFLSMVVVDQLQFNPNLSNNTVIAKQNPHGLTAVMICGTVHRGKQFIGLFEQTFGLIRDPSEDNNWKIKFSKLVLKATTGSTQQLEEPVLQQLC